jgi:CheY-like chemotaxis protein
MRRVLVIDDQSYVRATITAALGSGYEVVGVGDGKAGFAELQTSKYDVAIVDIYLPGMDGIKVIRQLRASNPGLPILAISGVELRPTQRTALDLFPAAGLADIPSLKKPFRAADIRAAIDALLAPQAVPAEPA